MNTIALKDPDSVVGEPLPAPRIRLPRMRLMLVSGYHQEGDFLSFMFVGSSVRTTWRVDRARFHPFSREGRRRAWILARALRLEVCPTARVFLMRVVLTGDPSNPDEVIEAWRLEGSKPRPVKYSFD